MGLENKVTVVTGGNSGIGFGSAEAFKDEGAIQRPSSPRKRSSCIALQVDQSPGQLPVRY